MIAARHLNRIYNVPLLVSEPALLAMLSGIRGDLSPPPITEPPNPEAMVTHELERAGLITSFAGPIAVIEVDGPLMRKGGFDADCTHFTGYQDIGRAIRRQVADKQVEHIMLLLNSPGGEVSGCMELAQLIRQQNQIKPITSMVTSQATSAAYWIASATSEISMTPTSFVGSIGIVLTHLNRAAQLEKEGVEVTFVYAGDHKVDGNATGPLPDKVRQSLQSEIDALYQFFVESVAENRGLSTSSIRSTQAQTYLAADAIDLGLADRIESADAALERIFENLNKEKETMIFSKTKRPTASTSGTEAETETETDEVADPVSNPEAGADEDPPSQESSETLDRIQKLEAKNVDLEVSAALKAMPGINIGMQRAGLKEVLVALKTSSLRVSVDGAEATAYETLTKALSAIPSPIAGLDTELAGDDSEPIGDSQTQQMLSRRGLNSKRVEELAEKYNLNQKGARK